MSAIPRKMKALVLTGPAEFEIRQVDTPAPGPQEVLVKVGAVAICGSDPAIVEGVKFKGLWPPGYPFIPGHEWSGTVVKAGPNCFRFAEGHRVAAEAHKGCGFCRNCMKGRYNLCENYGKLETGHRHYGFTTQGGYAEYVVASERAVHAIGDMPFDEATNVDTAATAMQAVKKRPCRSRRRHLRFRTWSDRAFVFSDWSGRRCRQRIYGRPEAPSGVGPDDGGGCSRL